MEIRHLLKSQAHQVFEAITSLGFEPSDFDWQEAVGPLTGTLISKLVHKPSDYYFAFDNYGGRFYGQWEPGWQTALDSNISDYWNEQFEWLRNWLSYVRRESETPDVWGEVSKQAELLEAAASADNTNLPFSAEEKAYIINGIEEIKQYLLKAHKIDPELVEARLQYLVESSERVGRKDWINLLISVLVGIVISAVLPPEVTRELFRFAGTVLRQIIRQPLLLQ